MIDEIVEYTGCNFVDVGGGEMRLVEHEKTITPRELSALVREEAKNLAALIAIDLADIEAASRETGPDIQRVLVEHHTARLLQHKTDLKELVDDYKILILRNGGVF